VGTVLKIQDYRLREPEQIETPAMLVFAPMLEHNIASAVAVCGSTDRLVPHFKTHKSAAILKRTIEAGITSYKVATLKEAEVVADAGARHIILAYPLAHPAKVRRLRSLVERHPGLELRSIASRCEHLELLAAAARACGVSIGVYIDLDTGMHRTGVAPGNEGARFYAATARTAGLRALGVHVFDGHTAFIADVERRRTLVNESFGHISDLWERALRLGLPVEDNIVGNSWSFHLYPRERTLRLSPGTWIYWDHRNAAMTELPFRPAALVLGQVIDRNDMQDTVTVDIGAKAVSDDVPVAQRFKLAGHSQAELTAQSEEHGVLKLNGARLAVGDFVLAVPGHACTTTVKYPSSLLVDGAGEIAGRIVHDARDR
jgi:D-serine deaminase-like pyridoxal phosphate-dependent protein